jgi:transposase
MRTLKLTAHFTTGELQKNLIGASSVEELKRWQILYLIAAYDGITARYLSDITGLSIPSVYLIVQRFNKQGSSSVVVKNRGGRRRSLLTTGQEKAMMNELGQKASTGMILTAYDIRKHVERAVGKAVSDDYLWDLFKRNGWVKQSPRPEHPKKDPKAQREFKKNSRTIWLPLPETSVQS